MTSLSPIVERLRQIGASVGSSGKDVGKFIEGRIAGELLGIDVDGIGRLDQPLGERQALMLRVLSLPSAFGQGEKTLHDVAVRDSSEIALERLALHWNGALRAQLEQRIATGLGLPGVELVPHKLLVYGPGQFFLSHQDTARNPRMVASLVLVWPSAHIGGELSVEIGDGSVCFRSEQLGRDSELRWCAFYADCMHELRPVSDGWRVALAVDVHLPATVALESPAVDAALRAGLVGLPDSVAVSKQRWAVLLDHAYTEHGLRWELLKGGDRPRVAALRAAAQSAGLELSLALVEQSEVWDAQTGGRDGRVELGELIDSGFELKWRVDAEGRAGAVKAGQLPGDHVGWLSPSDEDDLFDEEYEGWMGNYGCTQSYWYRRAAVLIETPASRFRARLVDTPQRALEELLRPLRTGAAADGETLRVVADLAPRLLAADGALVFPLLAELASCISDPLLASQLLGSFPAEALTPGHADALALLESRHGVDWLEALFAEWHGPQLLERSSAPMTQSGQQRPRYLLPFDMPAVCAAGLSAGWSLNLLTALLHRQRLAFESGLDLLRRRDPIDRAGFARALSEISAPWLAALAQYGQEADRSAALVCLFEEPGLFPPEQLRQIVEVLPAGSFRDALREAAVKALRALLDAAPRAPVDHALRAVPWTCRCELCQPVIAWAESATAERLRYPLAERGRRHVTEQLRRAGAAISHSEERKGSPYSLLLIKPADLHARDKQQRALWQRELGLLEA